MKKKQKIELRISNIEKKIITNKAKNAGLSTSEYLRRTALRQKVTYKLTIKEIEVYYELHKYRSALTNISNMFAKRDPKLQQTVLVLVKEVDTHLKKLL